MITFFANHNILMIFNPFLYCRSRSNLTCIKMEKNNNNLLTHRTTNSLLQSLLWRYGSFKGAIQHFKSSSFLLSFEKIKTKLNLLVADLYFAFSVCFKLVSPLVLIQLTKHLKQWSILIMLRSNALSQLQTQKAKFSNLTYKMSNKRPKQLAKNKKDKIIKEKEEKVD